MWLFVLHIEIRSDLWEPALKVGDILVAGTIQTIADGKFTQALLFEKARLIAPAGDGDIHATVGTFRISGKAHHIRQAAVSHQDFYAEEQVEDVLLPEICVPAVVSVKTAEAVELHHRSGILSGQQDFAFNQLCVSHIIKGENVIAIVFAGKQRSAFFIRQQTLIQSLFELK